MSPSRIEHSRGILHPRTGEQTFRLSRYAPADALACFIQHYWVVQWDLEDQESHTQETLPYPCVNLVVEHDRAGIFGVVRQKFSRRLEGTGWAFGVKFRPGGFYPFLQSPVCELTDTSVRLADVFGAEGATLETAMQSHEDVDEWIALVKGVLRERRPERDERVATVTQIVDRIATNPEITMVDDVAGSFDARKRTLQRLFRRYVGVGPKWVIQRYRLQEAADRLADGKAEDWTRMALDLGDYDQAHFIKDFTALVGMSPAEYARSVDSDA